MTAGDLRAALAGVADDTLVLLEYDLMLTEHVLAVSARVDVTPRASGWRRFDEAPDGATPVVVITPDRHSFGVVIAGEIPEP